MTRLEKCELAKQKGFRYDAKTGKIYGVRGKELTSKMNNGYILFNVSQKPRIQLLGHHFAWYMTYGNVDFQMLDHKNEIKDDNRIFNLRPADYIINNRNIITSAKGYSLCKRSGKWISKIGLGTKQLFLGRFNTQEKAREAYMKAKNIYHNGF